MPSPRQGTNEAETFFQAEHEGHPGGVQHTEGIAHLFTNETGGHLVFAAEDGEESRLARGIVQRVQRRRRRN